MNSSGRLPEKPHVSMDWLTKLNVTYITMKQITITNAVIIIVPVPRAWEIPDGNSSPN